MDPHQLAKVKCRNCITKGSPFTHLTDEQRNKVASNWQFTKRVDSHIQDMGKHCPHKTITEQGYWKVTDSRFETNLGSTFMGGEITQTSPTQQRLSLSMRHTSIHSAKANSTQKAFGAARTSISSKFSTSMRAARETNYSPNVSSKSEYDNLIGVKRPLVANLANVPTVKIDRYSKRNPDTLFYP